MSLQALSLGGTMKSTALMAEQGGIRLQRLVVRWRANRDVCVAIVRTRRLIDHRCQSHADDSQSVYWSEQTSMRTRVLLMIDWIKRGIFGRDLSKVSIRLSPCLQHVIVTASIPLLSLATSRRLPWSFIIRSRTWSGPDPSALE
jgi:hypothetical protein